MLPTFILLFSNQYIRCRNQHLGNEPPRSPRHRGFAQPFVAIVNVELFIRVHRACEGQRRFAGRAGIGELRAVGVLHFADRGLLHHHNVFNGIASHLREVRLALVINLIKRNLVLKRHDRSIAQRQQVTEKNKYLNVAKGDHGLIDLAHEQD